MTGFCAGSVGNFIGPDCEVTEMNLQIVSYFLLIMFRHYSNGHRPWQVGLLQSSSKRKAVGSLPLCGGVRALAATSGRMGRSVASGLMDG